MIDVQQEVKMKIPQSMIRHAYLSCPQWSQKKFDSTYGLIRDYDRAKEFIESPLSKELGYDGRQLKSKVDEKNRCLRQLICAYDRNCRRLYPDHVRSCAGIGNSGCLIVIGHGNLISNLGIIGWLRLGEGYRLIKSAWEEKRIVSGWEYSCLYYTRDGNLGIDKFSFDNNRPLPGRDAIWGVSGQPILWDGSVPTTEDLIAETYDVRHVYRLWPASENPKEQQIACSKIGLFMHVWMEVFQNQSQATACHVLKETAASPEFGFHFLSDNCCEDSPCSDRESTSYIEKRYLQSAVGVDRSGNSYIVQKHGSMKELGLTLKDMGAKRGILLDQGGSVGLFYVSQKQRDSSVANGQFIFRSRYFRETRLSTIVWDICADLWSDV